MKLLRLIVDTLQCSTGVESAQGPNSQILISWGGGGNPTGVHILYPKKSQLQNLSTQKNRYCYVSGVPGGVRPVSDFVHSHIHCISDCSTQLHRHNRCGQLQPWYGYFSDRSEPCFPYDTRTVNPSSDTSKRR